mmetsp:Transcript_22142/g.58910  ORF Transcript_22142/g.58910 Transcript_22142/m.58910 type:complete len:84 (+) Transcript_22142:306-557(+)
MEAFDSQGTVRWCGRDTKPWQRRTWRNFFYVGVLLCAAAIFCSEVHFKLGLDIFAPGASTVLVCVFIMQNSTLIIPTSAQVRR